MSDGSAATSPGQRTLANARVLIVGLGGLGCPASLALAAEGVRRFTFVDPDTVELTNLHRQPWHHTSDLGRPKAVSAAERLRRAFPGAEVTPHVGRLDDENALELFAQHALVIDGTDRIDAKFLLSDAAVRAGTPLIYGGVLKLEGQAMAIRPGGPCLRCLFETPPTDDAVPTCAQAGVLGPVAGYVGALQALLGAALLRGEGRTDELELLRVFDAASLTQRTVKIRRAHDCVRCFGAPSTPLPVLEAPRC